MRLHFWRMFNPRKAKKMRETRGGRFLLKNTKQTANKEHKTPRIEDTLERHRVKLLGRFWSTFGVLSGYFWGTFFPPKKQVCQSERYENREQVCQSERYENREQVCQSERYENREQVCQSERYENSLSI
jgi:hypothetical protein